MIEGYRSAKTLSSTLVALFVASILLGVVSLWSSWQEYELLQRAHHEEISDAEASGSDERQRTIALVDLALIVVTALVFLFWSHRVVANARATRRQEFDYTAAAGVYWWFVPIGNLFMPYRVLAQVWKASSAEIGDWKRWAAPPGLLTWWLLWILCGMTDRVAGSFSARAETIDEHARATTIGMAGIGLTIAAAVAAIWVVTRLTERQALRGMAQIEAFD